MHMCGVVDRSEFEIKIQVVSVRDRFAPADKKTRCFVKNRYYSMKTVYLRRIGTVKTELHLIVLINVGNKYEKYR